MIWVQTQKTWLRASAICRQARDVGNDARNEEGGRWAFGGAVGSAGVFLSARSVINAKEILPVAPAA